MFKWGKKEFYRVYQVVALLKRRYLNTKFQENARTLAVYNNDYLSQSNEFEKKSFARYVENGNDYVAIR